MPVGQMRQQELLPCTPPIACPGDEVASSPASTHTAVQGTAEKC